jgi:allophanate hydrolase subunit 2
MDIRQDLSRKVYRAATVVQIEAMDEIAVSVANRWMIGCPQRVKALVKSRTYLSWLP